MKREERWGRKKDKEETKIKIINISSSPFLSTYNVFPAHHATYIFYVTHITWLRDKYNYIIISIF